MSFISLILLLIFPLFNSTEIKINQIVEGEIKNKRSYAYYSTPLPIDIEKNKFYFIVQVTPIHLESQISDPDLLYLNQMNFLLYLMLIIIVLN